VADNPTLYFTQYLAALIEEHFNREAGSGDLDAAVPVSTAYERQEEARRIAIELVEEATRSGLPLNYHRVDSRPLGGGNTAELVAECTLHAPFVFKLDRKKKLADEGLAMRRIKNDASLPQRFRRAWPTVYAVRKDAPFAYLMEFFPKSEGWFSLEEQLYEPPAVPISEAEALRRVDAALDILFCGYEGSIDRRLQPSIPEDYVKRIVDRLKETANKGEAFEAGPLRVNGITLPSWTDAVAAILRADVQRLAPPFSTIVHGDPNPGNILMRSVPGEQLEVKLIDPKEWTTGDYLFDVAKLTHFFEGTAPAEKPKQPPQVTHGERELSYKLEPAPWTPKLVDACRERAREFAEKNGDEHWERRYELGMAANLLGLPLGRLEKKRQDAAHILFGEGLLWLQRFLTGDG
jgi:hypothetical protein